ncbi:GatB/YqeY domain-containing protein [Cellvibrio sp. KY-YJ-3]|uniref:GatB/YqeY domain-containing protein n=1 Tax=Cellvibrio sp. KY-YJ-3 TaxID=454662 RepID=UPI0012465A77|nr:GatB/YqeY domain-containing protein [Cellvibrio sp. KY-YJ-3]QEY14185.1 GatB/YqeY domain-containing protein [Cellvibrio sp. KY-YJ-3]
MSQPTLKDRINDALKTAMRAKEKERVAVLRLVMSEFKRIEVDERIDVDDTRALALLDKMVKQRRDSEQQYLAAGRSELAAQEAYEISEIQAWLPAALSAAELETIVAQAIADAGVTEMRDMGKAMALIKPQVQGRADMGEVSKLLKAKLSN